MFGESEHDRSALILLIGQIAGPQSSIRLPGSAAVHGCNPIKIITL
jgi:hypothetical protein